MDKIKLKFLYVEGNGKQVICDWKYILHQSIVTLYASERKVIEAGCKKEDIKYYIAEVETVEEYRFFSSSSEDYPWKELSRKQVTKAEVDWLFGK